MADHLDAPGLTSPAMDTRVDITDHYAFRLRGEIEDRSQLRRGESPHVEIVLAKGRGVVQVDLSLA